MLDVTRDGAITFSRLIYSMQVFFQRLVAVNNGDTSILGQTVHVVTPIQFILGILPELLLLIGIIIGLRVALRIFKKFSR